MLNSHTINNIKKNLIDVKAIPNSRNKLKKSIFSSVSNQLNKIMKALPEEGSTGSRDLFFFPSFSDVCFDCPEHGNHPISPPLSNFSL